MKISALIIFFLCLYIASADCPPLSSNLNATDLHENILFIDNISNEDFIFYSATFVNSTLDDIGLDKNKGTISFTPPEGSGGSHTLVLMAVSNTPCVSTEYVTFTINKKPRITAKFPKDNPSLNEGAFMTFSIEIEGQNLSYRWFLDGNLTETAQNYTYAPDYASDGKHALKVVVTNPFNYSAEESWTIRVSNTNRPPFLFYKLPDVVLYEGYSVLAYDLDDFFIDPDTDPITYSHQFLFETGESEKDLFVNIIIKDGMVNITSKRGFLGQKSVRFTARDDNGNVGTSNTVLLGLVEDKIICGDSICIGEDCTTCPQDCGTCDGCNERWVCTDWSNCIVGELQTRSCKEITACDDPKGSPQVARVCPNSCSDGKKNQNEDAVDCGGVCPACPACSDGQMNGAETDIDCGGSCAPCAPLNSCRRHEDCTSLICRGKTCQEPSCADGVRNQKEEGVDCGKVCKRVCPTCVDGIRNEGETGIDCGGSCPRACPACTDSIKNQNEKGVDCGGPCKACSPNHIITPFVVITAIIIFLLGIIELKFGFIFRLFKLDQNVLSLIFILRIWKAFNKANPHYTAITLDALSAFQDIATKGYDQEDTDIKVINLVNIYFDTIFRLSDTFRDEQIKYKINDLEILESGKGLLLLLYKKKQDCQTKNYKTALDAMRLNEDAIAILKELKDVL
jgi:hypothetical protein